VFRYVAYCAFFFLFILTCFWVFAWKWRTDIIASFLERSCPPYKVQVEAVEWSKSDTLTLSGIHFRDKKGIQVLHIAQAHLTTPLTSWIYWFLVPSTRPLFLSQLTLKVNQTSNFSIEVSKTPSLVSVDKVVLISPDGTNIVHDKQSGLLSEILLDLLPT
jgi:hypothetical protein